MAYEKDTWTRPCEHSEKPCDRCMGIRLYPKPDLCEECNTVHAGNSYNCPRPTTDDYYPFADDPPGMEQVCWAIFNAVKNMTALVKETVEMIPESTNKGGGGNVPMRGTGQRGGGQQRQRSGLPYLNLQNQHEHLSLDDHTTVRIIDCRVGGNQTGTSAVTLRLAIHGKSLLWGLSLNNPSLDVLTELFGRNENDWINKDIEMWLEEDRMTEKVWVHCGPVEANNEKDEQPPKKETGTRKRG